LKRPLSNDVLNDDDVMMMMLEGTSTMHSTIAMSATPFGGGVLTNMYPSWRGLGNEFALRIGSADLIPSHMDMCWRVLHWSFREDESDRYPSRSLIINLIIYSLVWWMEMECGMAPKVRTAIRRVADICMIPKRLGVRGHVRQERCCNNQRHGHPQRHGHRRDWYSMVSFFHGVRWLVDFIVHAHHPILRSTCVISWFKCDICSSYLSEMCCSGRYRLLVGVEKVFHVCLCLSMVGEVEWDRGNVYVWESDQRECLSLYHFVFSMRCLFFNLIK